MRKIKIGAYVLVKHEYKHTSPVSLGRTHVVIDVHGSGVLLKGRTDYLPLSMFELHR